MRSGEVGQKTWCRRSIALGTGGGVVLRLRPRVEDGGEECNGFRVIPLGRCGIGERNRRHREACVGIVDPIHRVISCSDRVHSCLALPMYANAWVFMLKPCEFQSRSIHV